ncbi:sulfite reductase, dissimilatory-type subunit alpha [Sulfurimicrobium lacus]|uniref:Sulfite reductase, dissimilatory-type subunit alpha n=1 Tax=Sulfurimicrobium lacus TaxID=2715678 RepID=A0A6F8V9D5_9PROT|nr:dissimilatory-type sulfite reductase subunit alpha [Sulfurimicrobium lacus]BCB25582.1 sulfite reductase, dissimilatory-type subunit alpha [Sulfurimicrobium lacus]
MSEKKSDTPMLDELESGPWPSFVTGIKRLAEKNAIASGLLGQLEHSYQTKKGFWKGGTVGVFGYGGGVIPRFTELKDENDKPLFPDAAEFHTLRVQPPAGMHYDTKTLRQFADIWEQYGSGLIAFHGQSGDIMFQGITSANLQPAWEAINAMGFDLGGAGPALRTSMSCVGAARCEMSCFDEAKALRTVINSNLDDMHRPSLPYKFKFKFSGCPNDCVNSIQRSDMATIGTWRDNIQVNEALARDYLNTHGMKKLVNDVIRKCPTQAITLASKEDIQSGSSISSVAVDDENVLQIENHDCVRCMHCLNVMPGALLPGKDKGVTILAGGKGVLKIGATMGTVIIPFMKLETEEDFEKLQELSRNVLDFFAENALEHERTGEMIERIGLVNFIEGIGVEISPEMIAHPRSNPYVRMDEWDEEVEKWQQRASA